MNHYQRLKVAQDAPPEVIRAAYRALATKLHPDRQGADTGPQDVLHSEMAALNAAYETLIDPKLRLDYDATLTPSAAARAGSEGPDSAWFARPGRGGDAQPESDSGPETRVDMDWVVPSPATGGGGLWPPSRKTWIVGGALSSLLLVAVGWGVWSASGQHDTEEALSRQYRATPMAQVANADLPGDVSAGPRAAAQARRPSVDEMARMSDEELVRALDEEGKGRGAPHDNSFAARGGKHPLDGSPLKLRTERDLVDPLAPEPAAKR